MTKREILELLKGVKDDGWIDFEVGVNENWKKHIAKSILVGSSALDMLSIEKVEITKYYEEGELLNTANIILIPVEGYNTSWAECAKRFDEKYKLKGKSDQEIIDEI